MGKSITHEAYIKAILRLEEFLKILGNDTPEDAPEMIEVLEVSHH